MGLFDGNVLVVIECANCHMNFEVTGDFQKARINDHKNFMCPNGHSNVYRGQSEEEKLRQERDRLVQRLAQKDDEIKGQRDRKEAAQRQVVAYKGVVTRTKKRIAGGACPCCNRTFQNLARHMAHQHADYVEKNEVA